jgi:hypothetical protein
MSKTFKDNKRIKKIHAVTKKKAKLSKFSKKDRRKVQDDEEY